MNDSDIVKMTIKIGGEHIVLTVPFDQQDSVRDAEKAAAKLYEDWRKRWRSRSDKEIMTMVAYQFAKFYTDLLARYEEAKKVAEQCSMNLSNIINNHKSELS